MFERFTDRARRVLVLAMERAGLESAPAIGTEHLLLGMIEENESTAAVVLHRLGVNADRTRAAIRALLEERKPSEVADPSPMPLPFTARAKKVLELSLREALQLGHNYIGVEHILLGLIREGEGIAAGALEQQGLALADVRREVINVLGGMQQGVASREEVPFHAPFGNNSLEPIRLAGVYGLATVTATAEAKGAWTVVAGVAGSTAEGAEVRIRGVAHGDLEGVVAAAAAKINAVEEARSAMRRVISDAERWAEGLDRSIAAKAEEANRQVGVR